jgi:predicted RNA-binding Zn-ribbon protein involved in translation (DUF1610 family)
LDQARRNCPNCGRGFAEDRLEVHLKSCTPNGFFAKKAKGRQEKSLSSSSLPNTSSVPSIKKLENAFTKASIATKNGSIRPLKTSVILPDKAQRSPTELPRPVTDKTLAKFCTSCGLGFPTAEAKFCGSCGEKRVFYLR